MTNLPPAETVDFAELAAAAYAQGASAARVRRASYLGAVVAAASVAPVGTEVATLVHCRRRPGRRACQTPIHVRRQQVPPVVRWRCPGCDDGGTIERWQETPWDLTPHLPPPEEGERRLDLRLEVSELDLLLHELHEERPALAVLHLARPVGNSLFELEVTPGQIEAMLEASAVLDERRELPPDRDFEVYMALQHFVDALEEHDEELELEQELEGEPGGDADDRAQLLLFPAGGRRKARRAAGKRPESSYMEVPSSPSIHRLHVELENVRPLVWRRIEVPSDIDLAQLHEVVQAAFGWEAPSDPDYLFDGVDRLLFCPPGHEHRSGRGHRGADRVTLHAIAPEAGYRLGYVYDFCAGWQHELRVEEVRPGQLERSRCLGGRGARPPGEGLNPQTFTRALEALADPEHPDRGELAALLEGPLAGFDPDDFDVAEADRRLAALGQTARR